MRGTFPFLLLYMVIPRILLYLYHPHCLACFIVSRQLVSYSAHFILRTWLIYCSLFRKEMNFSQHLLCLSYRPRLFHIPFLKKSIQHICEVGIATLVFEDVVQEFIILIIRIKVVTVIWSLVSVTHFDRLFFYASVSLTVKWELIGVRRGLADFIQKQNKQGSISQMEHSYAEIRL